MITFAEWRAQSRQMPAHRPAPWSPTCPVPTSTLPSPDIYPVPGRTFRSIDLPQITPACEFDGDD